LCLMVVGFVNAFLGIFFATALGLTKEDAFSMDDSPAQVKLKTLNFIGEEYPSKEVYFPATISEMVSDPTSASGKCFLAFMSIAAFALMFSRHSSRLRSVSVRSAKFCGAGACCFVDHARDCIPAIGILLVAYIYMTPANMTKADSIALWIHTAGAVLFIGGYGVFEAYVLYLGYKGEMNIPPVPLKVRTVCVVGLAIAGAFFEIGAMVTSSFDELGICCKDVWRVPTDADIQRAYAINATWNALHAQFYQDLGLTLLYNTASDQALAWKKTEFWGEVFSGVFLGLSLIAIWYYAEERQPGYVYGVEACEKEDEESLSE